MKQKSEEYYAQIRREREKAVRNGPRPRPSSIIDDARGDGEQGRRRSCKPDAQAAATGRGSSGYNASAGRAAPER